MSFNQNTFLKNANLKMYLFFLLFTAILAVIIKLAKVYSTTTTVEITVLNTPENLVFSSEDRMKIEVDYEANGFTLLQNSFKSMTLEIPFKELSKNNGTYEWSHDFDRTKVFDILDTGNEKVFVRPERLRFTVDSLAERAIPVVVMQNFTYSSGYGSDGSLEIDPPVVQIIGATDAIKSIGSIRTVELVQNDVHENINTKVALDMSELAVGVKLVPQYVQLRQNVSKYTEGTLEVPVEILNTDASVQLFPKKIKVFYQVPVKDFDRIRVTDFKVVCDFTKKNVAGQFMSLELEQKPSEVSGVRLGTKQVQYVIVN